MSVIGSQHGMMPGLGTAYTTYEGVLSWGGETKPRIVTGQKILSTCVDARSSPTTRLQVGLVMGKITSTGKWTNYSATATDGSQIAQGVLVDSIMMNDVFAGAVTDRLGAILVAGTVQNAKLGGLDQKARSDMHGRFLFDDDFAGNRAGWLDVVAKTANYTVTASDNCRIFTNQGATSAITFTLPTIAKGLRFMFYSEDNDGIAVAAATANTLVTHNDATADSVTFSTTGRNIGVAVEVVANADATKWLTIPHIWNDADNGSTASKAVIA